ncbi:HupE/UreJ family protein [Maricurvus nonylphenolicus]|uniref:HupE/UreJ family protein n=1 Tax=Maricurvus nonylphenolicus TaxID=1008307 RepID=UPI0036F3E66E
MLIHTYLRFLLVFLLLCSSSLVDAHSRSQSFSRWSIDNNRLDFTFTVSAREITRLPQVEGNHSSLQALLDNHLRRSISVSINEKACVFKQPLTFLEPGKGLLRAEGSFLCDQTEIKGEDELKITNHSFFTVAPSHIHYARIGALNEMPADFVLSNARREAKLNLLGDSVEVSNSFLTYLALGVEHILLGADHLIFVLTLLLVSRGWRGVIWLISGFTLGHSLTLGLAATGVLIPNVPVIEALIGFTIALVALEAYLLRQPGYNGVLGIWAAALLVMIIASLMGTLSLSSLALAGLLLFSFAYLRLSQQLTVNFHLHLVMTGFFGLIHGFGFANVLLEIGLPEEQTLLALLAFNLGVEAGQLAFLGAVLLCVLLCRKVRVEIHQPFATATASLLCGIGIYWFVERALSI